MNSEISFLYEFHFLSHFRSRWRNLVRSLNFTSLSAWKFLKIFALSLPFPFTLVSLASSQFVKFHFMLGIVCVCVLCLRGIFAIYCFLFCCSQRNTVSVSTALLHHRALNSLRSIHRRRTESVKERKVLCHLWHSSQFTSLQNNSGKNGTKKNETLLLCPLI